VADPSAGRPQLFLNMAVRARALMVSPWRMATVRAVALSRPAVMIPSGSGTDGAVIEEDVDMVLRRQQGDDIALEKRRYCPGERSMGGWCA
jgi:hypothetical protein